MKLLLPFALLLAALLAAFTFDAESADADLVVLNRSDSFTLDPQRMSYLHDFRLAFSLYEGLVRWNLTDYSIEPAAAERWSIDDDGLTYRFELAREARWSDGSPVTAHDFVYAFRRLLLPDTAADYSHMLFMIDGAEAFYRARFEQTNAFASEASGVDAAARRERAEELWDETLRRFDALVGVRALDQHTLEIRLREPCLYFLDLLCFAVCSPVQQACVEGWPSGWRRGSPAPPPFAQRRWVRLDPTTGKLEQRHDWSRPEHLVTNGPYVLKRWRYKRDMWLERNPHYHRPEQVLNDSVLLLTIEDPNTRVLAYETGEIDWLAEVGTEYQADMLTEQRAYLARHAASLDALLTKGKSRSEAIAILPDPERGERRNMQAVPAFATEYISLNCRPALSDGRANPFGDAAVRRAFVRAINREVIVREVTRMYEPVATTMVPPGSIAGYDSPVGLTHDPQAARGELESAGWRDRNGDGLIENEAGQQFPVVDLLYPSNSLRIKWMSLELKRQWETTLGVRVQLRGAESKFFSADMRNGRFMVARSVWYGDFGDPSTFLEFFRSTDGNNDRGLDSARVDALLDEARREHDPEQRFALLSECERVIVEEELPVLTLCRPLQVTMFDPASLEGVSAHPRLWQYYWRMRPLGDR